MHGQVLLQVSRSLPDPTAVLRSHLDRWPVIVAIVVGSLIILTVVLCVARCVCCGAECACCCFKACSCCCPSGGGKGSGHKRMKSEPTPPVYPATYQPPIPPPAIDTRPVNQQYRSHAAPTFAPAPEPERPQFARFDAHSKPANEDALPAMPSWGEATSVQVEETVMPEKKDDVEMDRLNHNGSVTGSSVSGAAAVGAARRPPARSPMQRSPASTTQDSYGFPAGYQNDSFVSGAPSRGPRNSPGPYGGRYEQQQDGYRGISPIQTQSLSPVYGGGYSPNQQYGRRSPHQNYNQQYGPPAPRHSPSPPHSNAYGYSPSSPSRGHVDMPEPGAHQNDSFAPAAPVRSPSPQYAPSGSTRYEPSAPSYPGQQTYTAPESAYPGQQTYQAYQPAQEPQFSGVTRKAVDGTWKEV